MLWTGRHISGGVLLAVVATFALWFWVIRGGHQADPQQPAEPSVTEAPPDTDNVRDSATSSASNEEPSLSKPSNGSSTDEPEAASEAPPLFQEEGASAERPEAASREAPGSGDTEPASRQAMAKLSNELDAMARNPTAHGPGAVASKLKALSREAGLKPERREQLRATAASLVATERLESVDDDDNEARREAAAAKEQATNALLERLGGRGDEGVSKGGEAKTLFQNPRAKDAP